MNKQRCVDIARSLMDDTETLFEKLDDGHLPGAEWLAESVKNQADELLALLRE